jgi:hypothetical protein
MAVGELLAFVSKTLSLPIRGFFRLIFLDLGIGKLYQMKIFILPLFIFYCSTLFAQPSLIWQHCTGGTDGEQAIYVAPTHDQGFIIAALASSSDGDITNNHGGDDVFVIRVDSGNNILWQKTFGGTLDDDATCILETSDHGFIFVGGTESNDGDVSGNHGDNDIWVVKIDSIGNIQWQKTFGDSTYDACFSIIQNSSGNFMVLGWLSDANWDSDYWLLNLDPSGNIIWQNTYGGSDEEWGYQVIQTQDGGYMLSGFTSSSDGDVTNNHGDRDVWLVKTDANGTIQWERTYGGSDDDWADNVIELPNGQFIFAAYATSLMAMYSIALLVRIIGLSGLMRMEIFFHKNVMVDQVGMNLTG